jgi:hypothetical protein
VQDARTGRPGVSRLPPAAWPLPPSDAAHLASLGYPHCDAGRCDAPPAWVVWHWWIRRDALWAAEVFLCEQHMAAYRRRRDIEIKDAP